MTSVREQAPGGGESRSLPAIRASVAERLAEAFRRRPLAISSDRLEAALHDIAVQQPR
jgi:hypothetical protein